MTKAVGLAYAFCGYKNPDSLDIRSILGALAKQLAIRDDQRYNLLEQSYSANNPSGRQLNPWDTEKLIQLLQAMINVHEHYFIVVDALDEIGNGRQEAIGLLQILSSGTENLKFLFTSRNEHDIRLSFAAYDHISIAAQSAGKLDSIE